MFLFWIGCLMHLNKVKKRPVPTVASHPLQPGLKSTLASSLVWWCTCSSTTPVFTAVQWAPQPLTMLNTTSNTKSTSAHIIILYFDFGREYSFLTMCDLCRLLTISIFNNETLQINKNAGRQRPLLSVGEVAPGTYSSSLILCCCAHNRFPICSKIN